jgi:hypothetical protein
MDNKKVASELIKIAKNIVGDAKVVTGSPTTKPTAKASFARVEKEVQNLVKSLDAKLKKHSEAFKKSGETDWGYVGSLGHVKNKLEDLTDFLGR